ncbi:MAG: cobyrinate a,c-diamide synthase [Fusobacteriaceae bacterium]
MRGFLLAGVSSGAGKTTVSMGLMKLLGDISPFKSGPDFIDPTFHKVVTGRDSYNLDLFLMGEEGVKYSFYKHSGEFAIVEGAMGLYDGINNSLDNFSAAHLSRVLKLPVILVVDGSGKGTSIAATVLGYKNFDPNVNIAGVIINKVASLKTYDLYRDAIEKYTGIPCLGYLKKDSFFDIESRHLGLLQAEEVTSLKEKIEIIAQSMGETIDLEKVIEISKLEERDMGEYLKLFDQYTDRYKGLKIGIAKDRAFSFYYRDNIELLEKLGVEIRYFSPMVDKNIPDVDFLYFGGGYPENYLKELTLNKSMIQSIREFQKSGKIILGECGGFIYLSKGIQTLDGKFWELCNLADCKIVMGNRLDISRFGYVDLQMGNNYGKAHEFHYSKILEAGEMELQYNLRKKDGREWKCGYSDRNFIAGYPHLHFFGSMEILEDLLKRSKGDKGGIY